MFHTLLRPKYSGRVADSPSAVLHLGAQTGGVWAGSQAPEGGEEHQGWGGGREGLRHSAPTPPPNLQDQSALLTQTAKSLLPAEPPAHLYYRGGARCVAGHSDTFEKVPGEVYPAPEVP